MSPLVIGQRRRADLWEFRTILSVSAPESPAVVAVIVGSQGVVEVPLEGGIASVLIRERNHHIPIKPSRPKDRRVDYPDCCDHMLPRGKSNASRTSCPGSVRRDASSAARVLHA